MVLCVLIFVVAMWTARRRPWAPRFGTWLGVAGSATAAGALLGVAVEKMLTESLGIGGWTQWGLLLAAGIVAPLLAASVQMSGRSLPTFLEILGPRPGRTTSRRMLLLGLTLGVTTVIAVETALGLVFDPRYKDVPFAALTMAVVPFWMLMVFNRPRSGGAADGRSRVRRAAGDCLRLYRLQRRYRQLAVAVDLPCLRDAGDHTVAGAGRAKPRISSPIAIPESATL
jgi:hypothetical protein